MILGLDISHHQGTVNFAATRSAGRDFVVIKATEGIGYTDPAFAANRKAAHAAGLIVGIYHFARDNSPAGEAAYFAGAVGALQPGELLVLDQEVTHATGNVPWCATWLAAVRARYGVAPLIYMNQGSATGVTSGDWTQVAKTNGLWLARYDNAPATQTTVAYWGGCAMKQYYDKGSMLGVAGPVDVNAFYGTRDQLLAYGYQGSTPVALTPEDINSIALAVWGFKTSGGGTQAQDRLTGIDSAQLPAIKAELDAVKAELDAVKAALAAGGGSMPAACAMQGAVLAPKPA